MAKLLVVDDDPDIIKILTRVLSDAGHDVMTAEDGVIAKKAIRDHRPALVICDIDMPNLSGNELIDLLKTDPKYQRIKIMILTAMGEQARWMQNELSADAFMAKPFDNEYLVKKVDELLKKNRVRVAPGSNIKPAWVKILPQFIGLNIVGVIVLFGINFAYNQIFVEPIIKGVDNKEVGEIGFLSDKIFLLAIPIFLAIIIYIVHLLNKIASNKD